MKLTDLNAEIVYDGTHVIMDCPCGECDPNVEHLRLILPFENPIGGGKSNPSGWKRTGETVETMTLRPSVQRRHTCDWHGWITNGEARRC